MENETQKTGNATSQKTQINLKAIKDIVELLNQEVVPWKWYLKLNFHKKNLVGNYFHKKSFYQGNNAMRYSAYLLNSFLKQLHKTSKNKKQDFDEDLIFQKTITVKQLENKNWKLKTNENPFMVLFYSKAVYLELLDYCLTDRYYKKLDTKIIFDEELLENDLKILRKQKKLTLANFNDPKVIEMFNKASKNYELKTNDHYFEFQKIFFQFVLVYFEKYYDVFPIQNVDKSSMNKTDLELLEKSKNEVKEEFKHLELEKIKGKEEELQILNDLAKANNIKVITKTDSKASFTFSSGNAIFLNPISDYESFDLYKGVFLHEMTHTTKEILNRPFKVEKSDDERAKEELVAELGSVFLHEKLGLSNKELKSDQALAYLKSWGVILTHQPQIYTLCVNLAVKSSEYLYKNYLKFKNQRKENYYEKKKNS